MVGFRSAPREFKKLADTGRKYSKSPLFRRGTFLQKCVLFRILHEFPMHKSIAQSSGDFYTFLQKIFTNSGAKGARPFPCGKGHSSEISDGREMFCVDTILKPLAAVLLLLRFLPFAVTALILMDTPFEEQKERLHGVYFVGTIVNLVGNLLLLVFVNALCLGTPRVFTKFAQILRLDCSYQDLGALAAASVICVFLAGMLGLGLRRFYYEEDWMGFSVRGKGVLCLIGAVWVPVLIAACGAVYLGTEHISIQEICRKTTEEAPSPVNGEMRETEISYVTLYNDGPLDCALNRVSLSESEKNLNAYSFRDITIPAGGTARLSSAYTAGLELKSSGGSVVYLSDGDGKLLDNVLIPALAEGESYRRTAEGGGDWEIVRIMEPEQEAATVPPPVFSHESGFYENAFELTLQAKEGLEIYYTLDGNIPDENSIRYTKSILVTDASLQENVWSMREFDANVLLSSLLPLVDKARRIGNRQDAKKMPPVRVFTDRRFFH